MWSIIKGWFLVDRPVSLSKMGIVDGDCIVLTCDQHLTREHMEALRDHVTLVIDALNVDAKVLILTKGISIRVLKTSTLPEKPMQSRLVVS